MHFEYILIYVVKSLFITYSIAYFKLLSRNKYVFEVTWPASRVWSGTKAEPFNIVSESILVSIKESVSKVDLYEFREIRMKSYKLSLSFLTMSIVLL